MKNPRTMGAGGSWQVAEGDWGGLLMGVKGWGTNVEFVTRGVREWVSIECLCDVVPLLQRIL